MKNITITLPDEVARKTRILAAEADTSMSQYLCGLIMEKLESDSSYQAAMKRYWSRPTRSLRATGQTLPSRDELHDREALR
jgi:predicted transcriptional regulator